MTEKTTRQNAETSFSHQADCKTILMAALRLAEHQDWETIRLADIAREMQIPLTTIYSCYRQKDELTDALLNHADEAMLEHCYQQNFEGVVVKTRINMAIKSWLAALSPYRRTLRQMLKYKLEFGHVHLQVGGLLRLSRTVQWIREASLCDATNLTRIIEEIGLSTLFSMVFVYWLFDESMEHEKTWAKLDKLMDQAEARMETVRKFTG